LSKALYFDAYSDNKSNGAFILMMQQQTQRRSWLYKLSHPAFPGEIIDKQGGYKFISQRIKNVDVKLVIDYKSE
jgi:hypothetical protein